MLLLAAELQQPHSPVSRWVALAFLALLLGGIVYRLMRQPRAAHRHLSASPLPATGAGATASPHEAVPDPLVMVLVAAAANAMIDGPHRIRHIRAIHDPTHLAWSAEGRRQIFSSHQTR